MGSDPGPQGGPECLDQGPDEREAGGRSWRRCDEGSRSERDCKMLCCGFCKQMKGCEPRTGF